MSVECVKWENFRKLLREENEKRLLGKIGSAKFYAKPAMDNLHMVTLY